MIYFIQDTVSGYIKIGKTRETRLKTRLKCLQIGTPNILICIGVIPNDNQEKKYHNKFISCHYRGEWYSPLKYILYFIKSLPHDDYVGYRGDSKLKYWSEEEETTKRVKSFQTEAALLHTYGEYKKLWLKYKDLSVSRRFFGRIKNGNISAHNIA